MSSFVCVTKNEKRMKIIVQSLAMDVLNCKEVFVADVIADTELEAYQTVMEVLQKRAFELMKGK